MSRTIKCLKSFLSDFFIGEYRNRTALISEEVFKSEYAIWYFLENFSRRDLSRLDEGLWILGESYVKTMQFHSNNESKCGKDSCYRKSLNEKQICKPGSLSTRYYEKVYIRSKLSRTCS